MSRIYMFRIFTEWLQDRLIIFYFLLTRHVKREYCRMPKSWGIKQKRYPNKEYETFWFMYKLYRHKLYRHNLYRHKLYRHKLYREQIVSGTNCIGNILYREQIVSCNKLYWGTNCIGHKLYRGTDCIGQIMNIKKRQNGILPHGNNIYCWYLLSTIFEIGLL